MQTILDILKMAGGFPTLYLKIENPPYMALVIEATPEPGPMGLPALSVVHYGEQNGRPHARPGDVLRVVSASRKQGMSRPFLLAQRLLWR
jgi:hypothetical protein